MVWSPPHHTRKKGWEFSANIQRGKLNLALSLSLIIITSGTPDDRDQILMVKFCVHNPQFGLLACELGFHISILGYTLQDPPG